MRFYTKYAATVQLMLNAWSEANIWRESETQHDRGEYIRLSRKIVHKTKSDMNALAHNAVVHLTVLRTGKNMFSSTPKHSCVDRQQISIREIKTDWKIVIQSYHRRPSLSHAAFFSKTP